MPTDRGIERLIRCIAGLACFGLGISMFITAELGLAPWDVFHQGVSEHVGIGIGLVIQIASFAVLLLWIPLRQRVGVGTILNAIEIGLMVSLVGNHLPSTDQLVPRVLYVFGGLLIVGLGSGLYIGAGLGTGPRDGLMVGVAARGISVHVARTAIEAMVLVAGLLLGGSIGFGTVAFTLGIGPLVHQTIPRLAMHPAAAQQTGRPQRRVTSPGPPRS